jgi:flagellar M-ring protein FliF
VALVPATELARLRQGARRFASGFTPGQRVLTALVAVGIVGGAVVFMSLAGKPTYAPLFTNLQPTDAAAITQTLATDHVPYQLQDGGGTILVPQNDVDQERLAAAQAGLPSSSTVGLSILDKEGLTTSQLTQQADYLRAIQGELEQTIDSINGVTASQVNVAMAADQTFALQQTSPSGASVLVDLRPGTTLTGDQVSAVVHLVSSSVPGLAAADVTVADSSGDLLAGPGVTSGGASGSGETAAYNEAEQSKVLAYLTSVLGPSNADVQVNAQLNYDQVKTTTNSIVPGPKGQPVLACTNTQTSSQTYSGTGSPPSGAAGSTTTPTISSTGSGNYSSSSSNQTCEPSTQSQSVTQAPGTVTDQSVAVLVNSKALPKGVSLASLTQGVSAAANIRTSRGDVLSVHEAPFVKSAAVGGSAAKSGGSSPLTADAKPLGAFLLAAAVLFLLWRNSKRARRQSVPTDTMISSLALQQALTESASDTAPLALNAPRRALEIENIIDDQPEEVADVLRGWLALKAPSDRAS